MYEMHRCSVDPNSLCIWCSKFDAKLYLFIYFSLHSALRVPAPSCHSAKLLLSHYVSSWLEPGEALLHNLFQVILLSCLFVETGRLQCRWARRGTTSSERVLKPGFLSPKGSRSSFFGATWSCQYSSQKNDFFQLSKF